VLAHHAPERGDLLKRLSAVLGELEAINGEILAHTRQVGAAVGGEQFVLTAWGPGVFGPGIPEIALRDAPIAAWRRAMVAHGWLH
jgi:hypothetical protein